MSKKPRPICPVCGNRAARSQTRYGTRHDCCGLWSWGNHPLADRDTHEARKAAHAAFDPIWQKGILSRGVAYAKLQKALGLSEPECHMKVMNAATAKRVPEAARQIWLEVHK